jgi:hypothetical protein
MGGAVSVALPSEAIADATLRAKVGRYETTIAELEEKGNADEACLTREKLEVLVRQEYRADPTRWARVPEWANEKATDQQEEWGSKAWFFDDGANAIREATEGAADEKENIDESDDLEDSPADDRQSTRVVRTFGSVFLEEALRGLAAGVSALELETGSSLSSAGAKFEDGFVIKHASRTFGTIDSFLGKGAMGFVYKFDYKVPARPAGEGAVIRCALKTIRPTATAKEQSELEKALALEIAIAFAGGRAVGIASVIDAVIPEPGASDGLMLVCVFVDGGDLEEAMHSGTKRNGRLVEDYNGVLYTDEGAKVWPLISIMLQIFQAFDHIHGRGIIHQVPLLP